MTIEHSLPSEVAHGRLVAADAGQVVLDATLGLHAARGRACAGVPGAGTVVSRLDPGTRDSRAWLLDVVRASVTRELLVVANLTFPDVASLLPFHDEANRIRHAGGHVVAVFDHALAATAASPYLLPFLASQDLPYQLGYGPLEVAVIDRSHVVLEAPRRNRSTGSVVLTGKRVVEAALRYLDAVRCTAVPASRLATDPSDLTARQHLVASMLAGGADDRAIAATLGVSIRTVRYEIAHICETFGVTTRFAAGAAYARATAGTAPRAG